MNRFYIIKIIAIAQLAGGLLISGCDRQGGAVSGRMISDSLYLKHVPPQPGEDSWEFVGDLKAPMWTKHPWEPAMAGTGQADLSRNVTVKDEFSDPEGRLETAYNDLDAFLAAGSVSCDKGPYLIYTAKDDGLSGESFRIDVNRDACHITAGNAEGIRRGIFYIEDEMLRLRGPFLPLGMVEKHPAVKRRISRCFFGPIKRPPKMKDELMDDVDYYPDQYLNRLAHEGVNGLWLTVEFRDLVKTVYTPEAGKDADQRLAKMRRTVAKCLRYGIRTYIFCIEPRAWEQNSPVIEKYPELAGAPKGKGHYFCPMSETAYDYLYTSVNKIFKAVPGLGGMINITHGERGTTCLSAVPATSDYKGKIRCSRCKDKQPWEILYASLSAMERGMHEAAPDAELISWLYMPQPQQYRMGDSFALADWVYDLPAHTPDGVILQFNFESGVSRTEFGKRLVGGDYWISNPGPSPRFERVAITARESGTRVSAKIQTGNSHEVATTPYIPVPLLLYRKFAAMHRLGVSHTMLCWYFGNYPGLMNKAAGMLSMDPFPSDEHKFLTQLAAVYWKEEDISAVVRAWKYFSDGFENYPLTNMFQYYGPAHDGPVWPLLLKPMDAPLSPTWQIGSSRTKKPWPPSGDRVGECIGEILTLEEVVDLTGQMAGSWEQGVDILKGMEQKYKDEPERLLDIGVAEALGIQFRSAYNILRFYLLREKMFRMEGKEERLSLLDQLVEIIREEMKLDEQLLTLSENDSRLGFHSEAEGYKYYPEKIKWRMDQLAGVLTNDVPEMRATIRKGVPLFPEYTGVKPAGAVAHCILSKVNDIQGSEVPPAGLDWQPCASGSGAGAVSWSSERDSQTLYFWIRDKTDQDKDPLKAVARTEIRIEPHRLYPSRHFVFDVGDIRYGDDAVLYREINGVHYIRLRIPLEKTGIDTGAYNPVRVNVLVKRKDGGENAWRQAHPMTPRLILGSDNPADLGWLVFKPSEQ